MENVTLTGKPAFTVLADGKQATCFGCGKPYTVDMSRTGTVLVCPTCAKPSPPLLPTPRLPVPTVGALAKVWARRMAT